MKIVKLLMISLIIEFMNNSSAKTVKDVDAKISSINTTPSDLTTFEFVCESCQHKDKVNFEMNPVNFS